MNIDEIMDMLDRNNPEEVQAKGRELARGVHFINVFLRPRHPGHEQNVWENCAIILAERSDEELWPWLEKLFEWLKDMDQPGAKRIYDRLMDYFAKENDDYLEFYLDEMIKKALVLKNDIWMATLLGMKIKLRSTGDKK